MNFLDYQKAQMALNEAAVNYENALTYQRQGNHSTDKGRKERLAHRVDRAHDELIEAAVND